MLTIDKDCKLEEFLLTMTIHIIGFTTVRRKGKETFAINTKKTNAVQAIYRENIEKEREATCRNALPAIIKKNSGEKVAQQPGHASQ